MAEKRLSKQPTVQDSESNVTQSPPWVGDRGIPGLKRHESEPPTEAGGDQGLGDLTTFS